MRKSPYRKGASDAEATERAERIKSRDELSISDEALRKIIQGYTREAGCSEVWSASSGRSAGKQSTEICERREKSCISVTDRNLARYLGKAAVYL